jgi:Mn-dependent DtxR family transcriptional regulator
MPKDNHVKDRIITYLKKQDWPSTTEDIAAGAKISWQTAQINLFKLAAEGKVKYKKVGRQNQWWIGSKYEKEFN